MRDLFQYKVSREQHLASLRIASDHLVRSLHTRWLVQLAMAGCVASLAMIATLGATNAQDRVHMVYGVIAAIGLACYLLATIGYRLGIAVLIRASDLVPGDWQLGFDASGVWTQGPHGEAVTRWSGWQSVVEASGLVLLLHDNGSFLPVPFSAFQSPEERLEFVRYARARIAENAGARPGPARASSAPIPEAPAPAAAIVPRPTFRSLAKAALRLAFFLRTREEELAVSWGQVVGVALATLVPPIVYALFTVGSEGYVAWVYLPAILYHVPVMLLTAITLAYVVGERNLVATFLVATLLASIVIDAVYLATWASIDVGNRRNLSMAAHLAPLAWLALAVTRFGIGLLPPFSPRRGLVFIVCALFLAVPLGAVYRERSLWSMDYARAAKNENARSRLGAASEEGLYRQPELLRRALADIKPGRKGVVDVYLVGVAGYGYQDVFMREVDSVAALFRERFHAEGHVITLINNPKTVLSQPLASATSLKAALQRIGEVMDRDEDVLVLFLTSHGSQDHRFSVELWPYELRQITPEMLREMLDASGIRNRVVIVSSCYAGGFVRALANDDTLVIAAAAPDRNSFGCSSENEWTYFGKAYFDEALRKTSSFTQAFEMAKPLIEEREKKENFDPSNPQIALGAAIKARLETLERQLESPAPAPEPIEDAKPLASPDKAEQYVGLLFQPEMARNYLETCRKDMELNGPEKTLERSPGTLRGFNHSNALWPQLVSAWDRYADEVCAKISDPQLFRATYLGVVRESMDDQDLDAAIRMLSSGEGRKWYEKEERMSVLVARRISEAQRDISIPLYSSFIRERDQLFAESNRK